MEIKASDTFLCRENGEPGDIFRPAYHKKPHGGGAGWDAVWWKTSLAQHCFPCRSIGGVCGYVRTFGADTTPQPAGGGTEECEEVTWAQLEEARHGELPA